MIHDRSKKDATVHTIEKNKQLAERLGIDPAYPQNSETVLAGSHRIRTVDEATSLLPPEGRGEPAGFEASYQSLTGETIFDVKDYDYALTDGIPDTVNPSLWLATKSSREFGVFSVVGKDIVQTRGFDIANVTFIRGKTGWIILDAASSVEGAAFILKFTEEALGENIRDNIRAILISHSHMDHFGGIAGVIKPDLVGEPSEGKVPIYAPRGFDQASRDEYVYAGGAMRRRGEYQVGASLGAGLKETVSIGPAITYVNGTASYIRPTYVIEEDQTIEIDGIHVDFLLADDTEAVANMLNYFREYRALWVADNCIGTMHNIYTMRGARIRDAKAWADSMVRTYLRYGEEAEVVFQGHAWPHWRTEETPDAVKEVLLNHAAAYQFTHDQSLLYLNQGYTANEISNRIHLPEKVDRQWYLRPYYGDVRMNARAVYNYYIGYYDANPIHLMPLSDEEEARKFVEYVGSEEEVLAKAEKDFEKGEYQYAAQAANAVVFVNPENERARLLCADALEQLGYQSESGIFRNAYLNGANELRNGVGTFFGQGEQVVHVLSGMDDNTILDYLGMTVDGNGIEDLDEGMLLTVVDGDGTENRFDVIIYGGTILKRIHEEKNNTDVRPSGGAGFSSAEQLVRSGEAGRDVSDGFSEVRVDRQDLIRLAAGVKDAADAFEGGNPAVWKSIAEHVVNLYEYARFNIVTP